MKFYNNLLNQGKIRKDSKYALLAVTSLLLLLFLQSSCRRTGDCASPPPSFYFKIKKEGITYPTPKDTLRGLGVYYLPDPQTKKYIPGIKSYDNLYQSSFLIAQSRELNDPEFVIEIEGQIFARLKLETSISKTRCNSWPEISKAYADGALMDKSSVGVYLITAK